MLRRDRVNESGDRGVRAAAELPRRLPGGLGRARPRLAPRRPGVGSVRPRHVERTCLVGAPRRLASARPIVLSFDDGFSNWHTVAYRILRRYHWPGTMNLAV